MDQTPRFRSSDPRDLSAEQRALYDLFTSGPRADPSSPFSLVDGSGRLQGPPAAWVLSPPLGRALEKLGGAVRFELTLPARAREIVILMVAHHEQSPFELHAHTRAGARAGLTQDDLSELAAGKPPALVSDEERAIFQVTRQILRSGTLDDTEYAVAVSSLAVEKLFELVTLIGYYRMLAVQLSVFKLLPPGEPLVMGV